MYLTGATIVIFLKAASLEFTLAHSVDCKSLRIGQFICPHPDIDYIDPKTQQPRGCTEQNKALGKL